MAIKSVKRPTHQKRSMNITGEFYTIVRHPQEAGNFMLRIIKIENGNVVSVVEDVQNLLEYKLAMIVDKLREAAHGRPTVI